MKLREAIAVLQEDTVRSLLDVEEVRNLSPMLALSCQFNNMGLNSFKCAIVELRYDFDTNEHKITVNLKKFAFQGVSEKLEFQINDYDLKLNNLKVLGELPYELANLDFNYYHDAPIDIVEQHPIEYLSKLLPNLEKLNGVELPTKDTNLEYEVKKALFELNTVYRIEIDSSKADSFIVDGVYDLNRLNKDHIIPILTMICAVHGDGQNMLTVEKMIEDFSWQRPSIHKLFWKYAKDVPELKRFKRLKYSMIFKQFYLL